MQEPKIQKALRLYDGGLNAHAAAQQAGLQPSAVYAALKKRRDKAAGVCTACGQTLPHSK